MCTNETQQDVATAPVCENEEDVALCARLLLARDSGL